MEVRIHELLDGLEDSSVPMEEMLPLIASYLDRYERQEKLPAYAYQIPEGSEDTILYELSQDEPEENRGHLTLARITGTWQDRADNMARGIICDVLTGRNEAMLKRAALERGLAEEPQEYEYEDELGYDMDEDNEDE